MAQLQLHVTAGASADHLGPLSEDVLLVRVTRPAAEGQANRAVLRLLARALGVAPSRLSIASGERSRRKRVRVDGMGDEELERRLRAIGEV